MPFTELAFLRAPHVDTDGFASERREVVTINDLDNIYCPPVAVGIERPISLLGHIERMVWRWDGKGGLLVPFGGGAGFGKTSIIKPVTQLFVELVSSKLGISDASELAGVVAHDVQGAKNAEAFCLKRNLPIAAPGMPALPHQNEIATVEFAKETAKALKKYKIVLTDNPNSGIPMVTRNTEIIPDKSTVVLEGKEYRVVSTTAEVMAFNRSGPFANAGDYELMPIRLSASVLPVFIGYHRWSGSVPTDITSQPQYQKNRQLLQALGLLGFGNDTTSASPNQILNLINENRDLYAHYLDIIGRRTTASTQKNYDSTTKRVMREVLAAGGKLPYQKYPKDPQLTDLMTDNAIKTLTLLESAGLDIDTELFFDMHLYSSWLRQVVDALLCKLMGGVQYMNNLVLKEKIVDEKGTKKLVVEQDPIGLRFWEMKYAPK